MRSSQSVRSGEQRRKVRTNSKRKSERESIYKSKREQRRGQNKGWGERTQVSTHVDLRKERYLKNRIGTGDR